MAFWGFQEIRVTYHQITDRLRVGCKRSLDHKPTTHKMKYLKIHKRPQKEHDTEPKCDNKFVSLQIALYLNVFLYSQQTCSSTDTIQLHELN